MKTGKVLGGSLGAIVILVLSQLLAQSLASGLAIFHVHEAICNIVAGILYQGFSFLLLKLFANKILKLSMDELGIPVFHIKMKWLVIAILLPLAVIGIYLLLPGKYVNENMDFSQAVTTICTGIFNIGIAAGFVEEMVFRGFILNLLEKRWNKRVAIIIPSALFGLAHIIGMDFSFSSCLLVLIAGTFVGIMFSLIAQTENSIWNSGIVHVLWNIIILGGVLSINEAANEYSMFTYVLEAKNFYITGGEFGIESSIIAVVAYVAVSLIAVHHIKNRRNIETNLTLKK